MENFPHAPTLALVAAAVVTLVFVLNKWLFGPLNEALTRRQREIDEARAAFESAQQVQDERLAQIEMQLAEARKDAFALREQELAAGKAKRDRVLAEARSDAAERVARAKAELQAEIDKAKAELDRQASDLARRAAERLLGRVVASGPEGS